jgi:hypothetical protein
MVGQVTHQLMGGMGGGDGIVGTSWGWVRVTRAQSKASKQNFL